MSESKFPVAAAMKPRLRAGGIHLLGSLLIAALAAWLVFDIWYPAPLAEAQGVSKILLMMIGIDVMLGPLATAVVFNPNKKKSLMKIDLAIIVVVQLAAMLYGMHTIFVARPALIVFNVDRFDVVAAADMQAEGLVIAKAQGKPGLPWFGPRVVAALMPNDKDKRTEILFSGFDLPQMAQWQVPYDAARELVRQKSRPVKELRLENRIDDGAWRDLLRALGRNEESLAYLPMRAKTEDGVVVVDARTADVVKILMLNAKWQ